MSSDGVFAPAQLSVVSDERSRAAHERARVAGYAAGWAEGSRAAACAAEEAAHALQARAAAERVADRARVDEAVAVLHAAAEAAAARAVPVVEECHETLLVRALELARAVVGRELADDERSARAAIARALAAPAELGVQTVRLHPDDLEVVHVAGAPVPDGVRLVADPSLARGDAISTFPGGYLDARVATAFDRAAAALAPDSLAPDSLSARDGLASTAGSQPLSRTQRSGGGS